MNAHETHREGPGCPCACHTGEGYRISCEHCGSAARFLGRPPAAVASVPTVDAAAIVREHWAAPCDCDTPCDLECVACGQPWRGGGADGGCTMRLLARGVVALRERVNEAEGRCAYAIAESHVFKAERDASTDRVALLEGLLREVEWGCDHCPRCPICQRPDTPEDHARDCRLAAALADGG